MTSPAGRPLHRDAWPVAVLLVALSWPLLTGATFRARVTGITDGDTVTMLREDAATRGRLRVRLEGIDAPERRQAFGRRARQALSTLIHGHVVEVDSVTTDSYGRMVARIHDDGHDVCLRMVRDGWAWHFRRYSDDPALARAEVEARSARRGLWQDPDPIAPWEFRRRQASRNSAPAAR